MSVCAKTLDPTGDFYYFTKEFSEETLKGYCVKTLDPKGDAYYGSQGS